MPKHDEFTEQQLGKIGARLKELRLQKGYSSYENFAIQHDISRMQYWRYEKGEDMRISSLLKITRALEVTLEEFFSKGFDK